MGPEKTNPQETAFPHTPKLTRTLLGKVSGSSVYLCCASTPFPAERSHADKSSAAYGP
jgi:hypothetical protein